MGIDKIWFSASGTKLLHLKTIQTSQSPCLVFSPPMRVKMPLMLFQMTSIETSPVQNRKMILLRLLILQGSALRANEVADDVADDDRRVGNKVGSLVVVLGNSWKVSAASNYVAGILDYAACVSSSVSPDRISDCAVLLALKADRNSGVVAADVCSSSCLRE